MIELASRRMMMGGSAKPYDAEVEYLQSTGTQYIDTGIKGNTNYRIIGTIYMVSKGEAIVFTQCTNENYNGLLQTGEGRLRVSNGAGNTDIAISSGTKINFIIDRTSFLYNDISQTIPTTSNVNTSRNVLLFCRNYSNGTRTPGSAKIHRVAIYNGSELLKDFVSVRKGNVGYMYESVSGTLYGNNGSGVFTVGPDKTN